MTDQDRPSLILAGPPGANLARTAYPILSRHNIPVRMAVADKTGLGIIVQAHRNDLLFLIPDLFSSAAELGEFLYSVPDTMPVLIGQPRGWSSNAGAVLSHRKVMQVFQQPLDWNKVAQTIAAMYVDAPEKATTASLQAMMETKATHTTASSPETEAEAQPPRLEFEAQSSKTPSQDTRVANSSPAMPVCNNVVAIWSGMAGGTGKSTIAANKAISLAREGRSVILLAFGGAARHMRLGGEGAGSFAVRPEEDGFRAGLVHWHDLPVIPLPVEFRMLARMAEMDGRLAGSVEHLVRFAADRYEVVIVDCPPGTSNWALHPLLIASVILLVSRPTVADQTEMARAVNLLNRIRKVNGNHRLRLALNDALPGDPDTSAFEQGLSTLLNGKTPVIVARIAHHPDVRRAQNEGVPLDTAEGLERVTAGIEAIPTPWGTRREEDSKGDREQIAPVGRVVTLGPLKVKVVD